ncbi:hypothetical protein BKA58DRAFT_166459 [Alternaria rosae]|uniref:uncharacterized protein n=1 Tax=Alternaria rosae TaxID=1187941 RepID=UPI001E8EDF71|nr:uncharacterized protein BKA58DRAFT_445229 [Alternaria rosae]XP_046021036.1 uncharacterized protein BKA58DRAFT_55001 [Alternaria rosae]XP_046026961.1 uncharacterized protein BKA58DRAFT_166459 [Alternaria rosae]KAH6845882.1 hypothetical protein BKA58DRAFT_445229 [Alternaria rosae]KAH6859175.1 hypothetical protein BKA58DRAFT_55001 [Alternaria rosae]KAH6873378.1 hypothetical protein BKA58DRAFT_166459 [Alternaria rosae]
MNTVRALTMIAVAAGAAAESAQWSPAINHVLAHAVATRDDHCAELPKLCTDAVLLRGYETTLTYLCPEKTEGPSTVTVTTTRTTTVTADKSLTSSVAPAPTSDVGASPSGQPNPNIPVSATSDARGPPAEELTTTVIIQSTVQVTITRSVTKVAPSSTSSLLPPPSITWSFTAVLPTDVKSSHVSGGSSSASRIELPSTVSSVGPPSSSTSKSFGLFPSHTVSSSSSVASTSWSPSTSSAASTSSLDPMSSAASTSSMAALPSGGHLAPPFANGTAISYTPGIFPTLNARNDKSTTTITSTVTHHASNHAMDSAHALDIAHAAATETKKGQAGDNRASFIALFFGVLVATWLI